MKKSFLITALSLMMMGSISTFAAFNGNVSVSFVSATQTQANILFGWSAHSTATPINLWNASNFLEFSFEKIDSMNGNSVVSQYLNYTGVAGDSVNLGVALLLTGLTAGHTYKVVPHMILHQNGSIVLLKDGAALVFQTCGAAVSSTTATICSGNSTTLSATGGTSYSWLPTTGLSNPSIANPVANPTASTTYTVTVTGTCTTTTTVAVTVKANTTPVSVVPTSGTAEACKMSTDPSITFTLSPAGGTLLPNGNVYTGINGTIGIVDVSSMLAGIRMVTYTVVDNNGCLNSVHVNVQIDSLPGIDSVKIIPTGNTKKVKVYGSLVSTLTLEVVGSTDHTYTGMQNSLGGVYTGVTYNGNTDVMYFKYNSQCFVEYSTLGVDEMLNSEDVKVFPNPVVDMINLETPNGKYQIDIVNCLGQTVYNKTTEEGNNFKIERNGLPSGVYFAKITSEKTNSSIAIKLMLQ